MKLLLATVLIFGSGIMSAKAQAESPQPNNPPPAALNLAPASLNLAPACVNLLNQVIAIANSGHAVDKIPGADAMKSIQLLKARTIGSVPSTAKAQDHIQPISRVTFSYDGQLGLAEVTHLDDDSCTIQRIDFDI